MSALLVVTFLCLHFIEVSTENQLSSYQYVLEDALKDQKNDIEMMTYLFHEDNKNTIEELDKLGKLKSDYYNFNEHFRGESSEAKSKIDELLEDYKIDAKVLWWNESELLTTKKLFYDIVEHKLSGLHEKHVERNRREMENRLRVVISKRKEQYVVGEKYKLHFQPVELCNSFTEKEGFKVEIDGVVSETKRFPMELSKKPDTVIIMLEHVNKVTGEKNKVREMYSFNSKVLP